MKLPQSVAALIHVATPASQPVIVPASPSRGTDFNYAVNGFRGVCILLVFVYHVYNSGLLAKPPYASSLANAMGFFFSSFRYGVELFFMISGYVIVASLKRHRSIGGFLWDRFARIFPVWVPVHLGIFTIGALFGLKRFHDMNGGEMIVTFFANLVLLPPLIPVAVTHDASWSLSYEWLFYLMAAVAAVVAHWRWRASRIALWVMWCMVALVLLCYLPRALMFIPGVIIGLGWLPLRKLEHGLRFPLLSLTLFLIAWRVVDIDEAAPGVYAISDFLGMMTLPFTMLSLLLGLYLFATVCADGKRVGWLKSRIPQFFGNISYSFYLWHPIVMFVVKRIVYATVVPLFGTTVGLMCFAVVSLLISVGISSVSHQLLEVRVSKALRQWFKRRAGEAMMLTDTAAVVRPAYIKGR